MTTSELIRHTIYQTRKTITRAAHAAALGVNISTLSAWSNAAQRPNAENLGRVLAYCQRIHACDRCRPKG